MFSVRERSELTEFGLSFAEFGQVQCSDLLWNDGEDVSTSERDERMDSPASSTCRL